MAENLKLGHLRVLFEGSKPFSILQIGSVFILLEKIYLKFSEQIIQNTAFQIVIDNIESHIGAFDLVFHSDQPQTLSYKNFEELTLCLLYSIYSIKLEKELETNDEFVDEIHNYVYGLMDVIYQGQCLKLVSIIDNKLVAVKIQAKRIVLLEKSDLTKPIKFQKNKEGILEAYNRNKEALFVKCNLEDLDLSNLDLSGSNFSGGELYKSNFSYTNLNNSSFYDADVSDTTLNKAIITNANLQEADFSGAQLIESDLSFSNLSDADFSSANFTNAILNNIDISDTDLSGAILNGAKFSGKIKFNNGTDFSDNANWWDANIEDYNLLEWLKSNFPHQ